MGEAVAYAIEPGLSAAEFVDVLVRSTLAERRPVDDAQTIAGMLARADVIVTARVRKGWLGQRPSTALVQSDPSGSLLGQGASHLDGLLVGVSRAITDFHYCTYLSDLAVDAAYQGRGIGRALVERTHDAAGRRTTLILLSAPKAQTYYPHIGMRRHDSCWVVDRTPPAVADDAS